MPPSAIARNPKGDENIPPRLEAAAAAAPVATFGISYVKYW